ncbi:MAG: two-component sensor histidine kinase [Pseudomonas sp.]|nr:two-component sensor histidine kinase [Pseudomonas sp.]
MMSIRRRTMVLILGLLLIGLLILSVFNLNEMADVYDAQLAQNARLLQRILRLPERGTQPAELYQAINLALRQRSPDNATPYESKIAFQVWNRQNERVVYSNHAPPFSQPPAEAGFDRIDDDANNEHWRTFVLEDASTGLRIWVGERNDLRTGQVNRIARHALWLNLSGSLILIAVIWLALGWGLKPLADLAAILRARHPGALEPLNVTSLPSELEPMQAALDGMLARIRKAMARERRFIADAAHEMRTPLAVLRVHAQNLLEAGTEEQRRASLQHLIIGVDRTSRLVNQLLTMARLEPHSTAAPLHPIDLTATVRDSLVQLTPWLLSKELELAFDGGDRPYLIKTDPDAINIALNNLVTNAANFSPEYGLIRVRLTQNDGHVQLCVKDQGPGINESDRERVFERFYSRGNDQGAGLGLTIVHTIATRMGGRITLENLPAGGLCATLELPVA